MSLRPTVAKQTLATLIVGLAGAFVVAACSHRADEDSPEAAPTESVGTGFALEVVDPVVDSTLVAYARGRCAPHRMAINFTSTGPSIDIDGNHGATYAVALSLKTVGRGGRMESVGAASKPSVEGATLRYPRRGGLVEWYRNGAMGLEQGFDLSQRPEGAGPLRIAIGTEGSLSPVAADDIVALVDERGVARARYGALEVRDVRGRILPSHIEVSGRTILLVVDDFDATYPVLIDPVISGGETYLFANDMGFGDDNFSYSLDLSADGSVAFIGAPTVDNAIGGSNSGAAYVFNISGSSWTQAPRLFASDGAPLDNFGVSVALSHDGAVAIVGASGDDDAGAYSGSAYVFVENAGNWTELQKIVPGDLSGGDNFATDVALSPDGKTALISAYGAGPNVGAAYVYSESGGVWNFEAKLQASDGAPGDLFGSSVSLAQDATTRIALIGATGDEPAGPGSGSAYVFVDSGSGWAEVQKLVASDAASSDQFGRDVDLIDAGGLQVALVGAPGDDAERGAVYAFAGAPGSWSQEAKLTGTTSAPGDFIGYGLSLSGDGSKAVIGAARADADGQDSGAFYFYERNAGIWSSGLGPYTFTLTAPQDWVGFSIAVADDGLTALIGVRDDELQGDTGSAYLQSLVGILGSPCTASGQCQSGFCVDGVCCQTACGGGLVDCAACSSAQTGDYEGVCAPMVQNLVCRASTGPCDAAETCTGASTSCPSDGFTPTGAPGAPSCAPFVCNGSSPTCPNACVGDVDCVASTFCNNGSCIPTLSLGSSCGGGNECASGHCVDGVCCDAACGGGAGDDCRACLGALTGASDGTCLPVVAGTVCRASAGSCDPLEVCDGISPSCPGDALQPSGTECRVATGPCDVAESCTGSSPVCPADQLAPMGTTCRASAGSCDVVESCNGIVAACPVDLRLPAGTPCRASSGPCDLPEACDGIAAACPADARAPAGAVCRASTGGCDPAETCSGTEATCPPNQLAAAGTTCRPSVDLCDAPEVCSGGSAFCPTDLKHTIATVCRPAVGVCDQPEACDGSNDACPADVVALPTTVCRPSSSSCDAVETCDGASSICPSDTYAAAGTPGNPSCAPYLCSGSSGACASTCATDADCASLHWCDGGQCVALLSPGASCTSASQCASGHCVDGVCCNTACGGDDETDCQACHVGQTGMTSGECGPVTSGTTCRASAGTCDLAEVCDGLSTMCPDDELETAGTTCRSAAGECDLEEVCDGQSADCPSDVVADTAVECRPPTGPCDVAEVCDGATTACPPDQLAPDGAACDDGDSCTAPDVCLAGACSPGNNTCGGMGGQPQKPSAPDDDDGAAAESGCACRAAGASPAGGAGLWLFGLVVQLLRRKRRRC